MKKDENGKTINKKIKVIGIIIILVVVVCAIIFYNESNNPLVGRWECTNCGGSDELIFYHWGKAIFIGDETYNSAYRLNGNILTLTMERGPAKSSVDIQIEFIDKDTMNLSYNGDVDNYIRVKK